MGPPDFSPRLLVVRYLTASTPSAYLVAMPKMAVTHIQNTAPGPPATTAVATPAMLPVPMVADSAVISAPKCDTSPSWSLPSSFLPWGVKACFSANTSIENCRKRSRRERYTPVPTSRVSMGTPQTQPPTTSKNCLSESIRLSPFLQNENHSGGL